MIFSDHTFGLLQQAAVLNVSRRFRYTLGLQGQEVRENKRADQSTCPSQKVKLSGSVSSQYLTALLMAAPLAVGDIEIEIIDKLISVPYVEMTLKLMERFGVAVEHTGNWDRFFIKGGQKYKSPGSAYVEGDALKC
ncbi:5-enolpyruvylshikimate-3-phosphate synthase [Heracleum sosnowskyi]|uniref:5-enolpyruvylshikimate-3-phosphate synthase n=1 Tax=Heracleum sosnowskyi TaxID=360622 RepID=A0AAD8MKV1_9APIA|nr:5-enolpyruvylshikimate-3-phosphate synthase [Heracleum sosnowskyi]